MKFSCGETWEAQKARLKEWHPFFCLVPRTISSKNGKYQCVWLETIERQGEYNFFCGGWSWAYREKTMKVTVEDNYYKTMAEAEEIGRTE